MFFKIPNNNVHPKAAELNNSVDSASYLKRMRKSVINSLSVSQLTKDKNLSSEMHQNRDQHNLLKSSLYSESKYSFKFDILANPSTIEDFSKSTTLGTNTPEEIIETQTPLSETGNNMNNNITFTKTKLLTDQIITKQSSYYQSRDYYRDVISEKIKIENIFRRELISVVEKLHLKRIEKVEHKDQYTIILKHLSKLKEELELFICQHEAKKKQEEQEEITQKREVRTRSIPKKDSDLIVRAKTEIKTRSSLAYFEKLGKSKKYEEKKSQFEKKVVYMKKNLDEINKKIKYIEIDTRLYKVHLDTMIKDQRIYYLDILSNGVDVR